jgi:hypothetical protein
MTRSFPRSAVLAYSESVSAQKTPVAIRITRPYQTEDEFLARELDTISRTGVTLVGAQPRPEGVVLRFELALASGTPLLRGEGRVVGYKANALGSEPGLSLRFTRLDSKSKALVDRVGSMRDVRRSMPPPPNAPAQQVPLAPESTASADAIPISVEGPASSPDALPLSSPTLPKVGTVPLHGQFDGPTVATAQPRGDQGAVDRDGMLDRLRKRANQITPTDLDRILTDGAARRRR